MRARGWTALDLGVALAVCALILAAVLFSRGLLWHSQTQMMQAAVQRFARSLAQYRERNGHLPGDANRDGEIDAIETNYVAGDLARAGLAHGGATQITVDIAGRTVLLRLIARGASAVLNAPRGRNVIELWGLPCQVAQNLDAAHDDGNFSRGNLRAGVAACIVGGENDPVPVMAVALPA